MHKIAIYIKTHKNLGNVIQDFYVYEILLGLHQTVYNQIHHLIINVIKLSFLKNFLIL